MLVSLTRLRLNCFQSTRAPNLTERKVYRSLSVAIYEIFREKSYASYLQNYTTNLVSPNQEHDRDMKSFVTGVLSSRTSLQMMFGAWMATILLEVWQSMLQFPWSWKVPTLTHMSLLRWPSNKQASFPCCKFQTTNSFCSCKLHRHKGFLRCALFQFLSRFMTFVFLASHRWSLPWKGGPQILETRCGTIDRWKAWRRWYYAPVGAGLASFLWRRMEQMKTYKNIF